MKNATQPIDDKATIAQNSDTFRTMSDVAARHIMPTYTLAADDPYAVGLLDLLYALHHSSGPMAGKIASDLIDKSQRLKSPFQGSRLGDIKRAVDAMRAWNQRPAADRFLVLMVEVMPVPHKEDPLGQLRRIRVAAGKFNGYIVVFECDELPNIAEGVAGLAFARLNQLMHIKPDLWREVVTHPLSGHSIHCAVLEGALCNCGVGPKREVETHVTGDGHGMYRDGFTGRPLDTDRGWLDHG